MTLRTSIKSAINVLFDSIFSLKRNKIEIPPPKIIEFKKHGRMILLCVDGKIYHEYIIWLGKSPFNLVKDIGEGYCTSTEKNYRVGNISRYEELCLAKYGIIQEWFMKNV